MSGHTPAPWLLMKGVDCTGRQVANWAVVTDDLDTWVCTGPTWDEEFISESESNGRLIAASPRMYEYILSRAESGDSEAISIISEIDNAAQPEASHEQ